MTPLKLGFAVFVYPGNINSEWSLNMYINPYLTNGFSNHYHLGESNSVLGASGVILNFIQFFDESSLSKQKSPRWDAAFCGVTSGAIVFAYAP